MTKSVAEGKTTQLLRLWRQGDEDARDQLMALVYPELRKLAGQRLRSERSAHTLNATALVNEAYLKLAHADIDWADRAHFYAVAAVTMRRILVDYGRRRRRKKRDSQRLRVTFTESLAPPSDQDRAPDVVAVDEALERLAKTDQRQAQVIELAFFGGLTYEQMAEVLGVSATTIKRDLRFAKAWLSVELTADRDT